MLMLYIQCGREKEREDENERERESHGELWEAVTVMSRDT